MTTRPTLTRHDQRSEFAIETRIRLLEDDVDDMERTVQKLNAKLDRIFYAIVMGALTLAGNLLLRLMESGTKDILPTSMIGW